VKLSKIEKYNKPSIPNKKELYSSRNILTVFSVGLLTVTFGCSANLKIVDDSPISSSSSAKNFPNPFMPDTTIQYNIEGNDKTESLVEINIYNSEGTKVKTFSHKSQIAGEHKITWDGKADNGEPVPSGVYFYKISINGNVSETIKMILMK
jgi:hypothetical protein